jgi:hypothetical protein
LQLCFGLSKKDKRLCLLLLALAFAAAKK